MENQFIVPLILVRLVRWTEKNRLRCYHCSSTIFVLCFYSGLADNVVAVVDVGYVCDKGVGFVTNKLNEMTG